MSWWRAEQNGSDASGANTAIPVNGASFAEGHVGRAFAFDGISQVMAVANAPSLNPTNALTIEAWVYLPVYPASSGVVFVGKDGVSSNRQYLFGVGLVNGQWFFRAHVGLPGQLVLVNGTTPLETNHWYHAAMTYEGSALKLYVDGQLDASIAASGPIITTSEALLIGGSKPGPWYFQGLVDELSLYDRALGADEIAAVYDAAMVGKCAPPVITTQPQSQTVPVGASLYFSVGASGEGPLQYQWWFNGSERAGATNQILDLQNVQAADAGNWWAVASDAFGSVTSQVAVLTVQPEPPVCAEAPPGLVGWWPGEGNFEDATGVHPGAARAGVNFTMGLRGQAFSFAQPRTGVPIDNAPAFQSQDFTIEAWVRRASLTRSTQDTYLHGVIFGYAWGGYALALTDDGRPYLSKVGYSSIMSTRSINDTNTYHHVAVTKSGSDVIFYLDGVAETVAPYNPGFVFNGPLAIGARGLDFVNTFWGAIDEVAIFNRPLTSAEVQGIYAADAAGKCALDLPFVGIVNGSFEEGLTNWSILNAIHLNGPPTTGPVGTDGTHAANIGGYDTANSALSQSVRVTPGSAYELQFDSAANAASIAGRNSVVEVAITAGTGVLASLTYQDVSVGTLNGTNGFSPRRLGFAVPADVSSVVIKFSDRTPNGGRGVDGVLDHIRLLSMDAPMILGQPQSQTIFEHANVAFAVDAAGAPPLAYQWWFNDAQLPGATSPTLALNEVASAAAGAYFVVVANALGSVTSAVATLTVEAIPACGHPASGLISWWRAEGNTMDAVSANNGTTVNGAGFAAGKVGRAFAFNGSNQVVQVPNAPSLNPTAGLTIEGWVNIPAYPLSSGVVIVGKDGVTTDRQYLLGMGLVDGRWVFRPCVGVPGQLALVNGSVRIETNTWYHVAMTYDGAALKLYVNGAVDAELAVTGPIITTAEALLIGGSKPGPWYFHGRVDELSLYGRALSGEEIMQIRAAGAGGKCVEPIAPYIVSEPQSRSAIVGADVVFGAPASGTAPLSWQWWFNGAVLTDATNATLELPRVSTSAAGTYFAVVANGSGSVTSQLATLTVNPAPWVGILNGSFELGLSSWTVLNAVHLYGPPTSGPVGTDGSHAANLGGYDTLNSALWQSVAVSPGLPYRLSFDSAAYAGVGLTSVVEVTVTAGPQVLASLTYADRGVGLLNGTNGFSPRELTFSVPDGVVNVVIRFTDRTPNGGRGIDADIDNVRLERVGEVLPPDIVSQPRSQTVSEGTDVAFDVQATGTQPLSYQWWYQGIEIPGATARTLQISGANLPDAGAYFVVVANAIGFATSSVATLTVTPRPPCGTVPGGLVHWWAGEGDPMDRVGGNDGAVVGAVSYAGGEVGQAFNFDGYSSGILAANSPDLGTNGFTIEAWVWPNDPNTPRPIVEYAYPSGIATIHLWYNMQVCCGERVLPGGVYGLLRGASGQALEIGTVGGLVRTGQWSHVALTFDRASRTGSLYVNGMVVGSRVASADFMPVTTVPVYIGHRSETSAELMAARRHLGRLDEISIYQRALSAAEIAGICGAGSAGKCAEATAPRIISQPRDLTSVQGSNAAFSVVAGGTSPLSYQWYFAPEPITNPPAVFGSMAIAGATNANFVVDSVHSSDAGYYSVLVSNAIGTAMSRLAHLTVQPPPTSIEVVSCSVGSASEFELPIRMLASGSENALSFTLQFDPSLLQFLDAGPGLDAGTGANLVSNTNEAAAGRVGLGLALPAGARFTDGTQDVIHVSFRVAAVSSPVTVPISFGSQPTLRQVADDQARALASVFVGGEVQVNQIAFEADVAPRPGGDNTLSVIDWVQVGRFVAGLDTADLTEFQRADCAPVSTKGNGVLSITDWVQAGRFAAGASAPVAVGGPEGPLQLAATLASVQTAGASSMRTLSMSDVTARPGEIVSVKVRLDAAGDENALGFSVVFDPAQLTCLDISPGTSMSGAQFNRNLNGLSRGVAGIAAAFPLGRTFAMGEADVALLTFRVAAGATGSSVGFADQPVVREVSDATAEVLPCSYTPGQVIADTSVPTGPPLGFRRSGNSLVLFWTVDGKAYDVEAMSGAVGTAWQIIDVLPIEINGQIMVILPIDSGGRFYRLHQR